MPQLAQDPGCYLLIDRAVFGNQNMEATARAIRRARFRFAGFCFAGLGCSGCVAFDLPVRDGEVEGGALAGCAFQPDLPAHEPHQLCGNG